MNEPAQTQTTRADRLSIGVVVDRVRQQHPSVTASSLRFLEREGLITPERTPGGHRLYSQADVNRVLQIKTWQEQRLSLDQIRERLGERDRLPHPLDLADGFLRLILEARFAEARSLVLHADTLGMPLGTIFSSVLQPVLFEVGRRWEHGQMLVAQEKETSELVRDLIAELSQRHDATREDGPAIVAGCIAGERHELGLRMLSGLLRARGCRVHYLGADVDHEFLIEAVTLRHPDALLLSVKLAPNVEQVKVAVERLDAALLPAPVPPILVGGEAVGEAAERIRAWGATPVQGETFDAITDAVMAHLPETNAERAS